MSNLVDSIRQSNRFWLKDVLTGAGLTLGTSTVILTAINALINQLRDDLTKLPLDVLQFAHLAGLDYSISIVLGAVMTKTIQDSTRLMLMRN